LGSAPLRWDLWQSVTVKGAIVDLDLGLAYYDESTAEQERSQRLERAWRTPGDQELAAEDFELEKDMVWLECDFEFVDTSSVKILGARNAPLNTEMVRFVCPHCGKRHESLRFR
jgi:hypothetical protein